MRHYRFFVEWISIFIIPLHSQYPEFTVKKSVNMLFEQRIIECYNHTPIEITYYLSIYALIISPIFVIILSILPGKDFSISSNDKMCCIQDFILKIIKNKQLFIWIVTCAIIYILWNICGTYVNKYIKATGRMLCTIIRAITIWIIEVFIIKNKQFNHNNKYKSISLKTFIF